VTINHCCICDDNQEDIAGLKAQLASLESLVQKLACYEGYGDEYGWHCSFCGVTTEYEELHENDCPVMTARQLTDEEVESGGN
jgi:hypothetical protein